MNLYTVVESRRLTSFPNMVLIIWKYSSRLVSKSDLDPLCSWKSLTSTWVLDLGQVFKQGYVCPILDNKTCFKSVGWP